MTEKLQNHHLNFSSIIIIFDFLTIFQYIASKEKAGYDPGISTSVGQVSKKWLKIEHGSKLRFEAGFHP